MTKKTHKKGNPGRGGKQPGAGKPKKVISPKDIATAEQHALNGHLNGTIATLMGWDAQWLDQRKDIRKKLTKKRAERKVWLRSIQDKHAKTVPAMAIFLGKNELDQSDKQDLRHDMSSTLADFLKEMK